MSPGREEHGPSITVTGGCQCGAVRYEALIDLAGSDEPEGFAGVHFCHCTMCRRATGSPFGTWLPASRAGFIWTKGAPKVYRSSHFLERLFCADCGTPLGSRYVEGLTGWPYAHLVGILVGTLDDPELVRPAFHFGIESRISWIHISEELPQQRTDQLPGFAELWARGPAAPSN